MMEAQAKAALINKIFESKMRELNARDMLGLDKLLVKRGESMPCPPGQYSRIGEIFADTPHI